jgi:hypothetical protein
MTIIKANAYPEKSLFLDMFIRDLSLVDCVLDLIDNSIDSLIRNKNIDVSEALLPVQAAEGESSIKDKDDKGLIEIKYDAKSFKMTDACGGISLEDAQDEVFRFGHKPNTQTGQLGVYGIGLKRAIFKIGNQISIQSRTNGTGFKTDIDVAEWAKDDDWHIPLEVFEEDVPSTPAGTSINIRSFRPEVAERFKSKVFEKELYDMIAKTYCLFLNRYVDVVLNGSKVEPKQIPLGKSESLSVAKDNFQNGDVNVTLYAGLASRDKEEVWHSADAGWYAACNGRFVVTADKTAMTGWGDIPMPTFVPKYRGFIGIAFFYSKNPFALPWTTTKRGINRESLVYQESRTKMAIIAKPILRFLDAMYSPEESSEREPQRQATQQIQAVDVRDLTEKPTENFIVTLQVAQDQPVRVQFGATKSELDRIRKCLKKSSWPATKIGRFTFDHYLKTECPE